jgi:hypothetical protein
MNKLLFILFLFFNTIDSNVFDRSIEESNPSTVFQLIMDGHNPSIRNIGHSRFKLNLIFRRLSIEELAHLQQFKNGAPLLTFSLGQIRQRKPLFTDLIVNCLIQYPEIAINEPESLRGLPLGRNGHWIVEDSIVRYISDLHSSYHNN